MTIKIAGVEVSAQYSSMPEASASYDGRVVQYSGDEGEYKTGHFYLCKASGSGYAWGEINPSTITSVNGLDGDVVLTGDNVMSTTGVSLNDAISAKLSDADVVNSLSSTETKLPLSANMGKTLNEKFLPLEGGTMTGDIVMGTNAISIGGHDLKTDGLGIAYNGISLPAYISNNEIAEDGLTLYWIKYGRLCVCSVNGELTSSWAAFTTHFNLLPASLKFFASFFNDGTPFTIDANATKITMQGAMSTGWKRASFTYITRY